MTHTCPDCRRPHATAAQHHRVTEGDALIDLAVCWSRWMADRLCEQLTLRAEEEDAELLALARTIPREVLDVVAANPDGFAAVCEVLRIGAKHGGGLRSASHRDLVDHAAAAVRHALKAIGFAPGHGYAYLTLDDEEPGATHCTHAACSAARSVLALQVAADRGRGGGEK